MRKVQVLGRALIAAFPMALAMLLIVLAPTAGRAVKWDEGRQTRLTLAQQCAAFHPRELPNRATMVRTEMRGATEYTPDVCIVRGKIVTSPSSTINWAVELPDPRLWNRRTVTIGGGGFDGFIPTDDPFYQRMIGRTAIPFVRISSDSGHQSTGFGWAVDDVALQNHAYEANHLVLGVGADIATKFYGKAPIRRYMFGQSNGGRSGLAATQRYPKDYDGVLALEPAISQQAHEVNLTELNRHIFAKPENWLNPAKIALFAKAEIKACDGLDGLKDGIIGNGEACDYVPKDLLCKGADTNECLTAGQIETVRLIYSDHHVPVRMADGTLGYPRFSPGGAATSDWSSYLFGSTFEKRDSFNYFVGDEAAKVVTENPNVDYMTYDMAAYQSQWSRLSRQLDSTNPDLSGFAHSGGKLLIWIGMADSCVPPYRTAQYFHEVQQRMGAKQVRSFARLLESPGIGHNLDGPGAMPADLFGALVAWTERGTKPDDLVATKLASNASTPTLKRPVCEYPKFPRYDGSGDPSRAGNFACSKS